jgi:aminoglycoside phosphotransferase (APT) family kinase protein
MTTFDPDLVRSDAVGKILADMLDDDRWLRPTARLITGGKSNLTFELSSPAGAVILRRPPTGPLLRGAHDMHREARVQRALAATAVPVPRILLEETEPGLLDTPYYLMQRVEGHALGSDLPAGYATTYEDRLALTDTLIDTLATLHEVDPAAVGLQDFGRPNGFMARQIRTWSRQWESAQTRDLPAMTELGARLAAHEFVEPRHARIVHGDYRFDNCLFDRDDPHRLNAVLDWELATLGDPTADLAMLLFYWVESGEPTPVLTPDLTARAGFPGREHLVSRYRETADHEVQELNWHLAFAHFKFAAIAQGIAARVDGGQMAGQSFGDLHAEVARIARNGLAVLEEWS